MIYFKHSCNAHTDEKLIKFMDSLGRDWSKGYFYFFTLLELFGNNSDIKNVQSVYKFHTQTVRQLWRCSAKTVNFVCKKLTESELIMCKIDANYVLFEAPNFMKYFGFEFTEEKREEEKKGEYNLSRSGKLTSDQESVVFNLENLKWEKNPDYHAIPDLEKMFPNLNVKKEIDGITEHLIKNIDKYKEQNQKIGFNYLVNCLKKSKNKLNKK